MTGILKVDQWKDSGDNTLMTSDGAGNLTANTDINLGGSIIKNGNLIADVSGNIRLDADDAGEIRLLDGGTQYAALKNDSSRLKIQGIIQDQDILVVGNDGGVETTALSFDMSEGGRAIFYGGVALGGTGSANALDDYEEGTFTATLRGATEPGTLITTTGVYTKVGRQVSFQIDFNGVNTTGYGGAVDVYGLPFANSSSGRAMCSVGMYLLFSFDSANYVVGEIGTNNTIVTPQQIRSANSWAACSHNAGSDRYIWITGTYQTN